METKEISDLGLIAALMSIGYAPIERRRENRRVIFIFETDEVFEQKCNDWTLNRFDVDAHTYYNTLRGVKASLYQVTEE